MARTIGTVSALEKLHYVRCGAKIQWQRRTIFPSVLSRARSFPVPSLVLLSLARPISAVNLPNFRAISSRTIPPLGLGRFIILEHFVATKRARYPPQIRDLVPLASNERRQIAPWNFLTLLLKRNEKKNAQKIIYASRISGRLLFSGLRTSALCSSHNSLSPLPVVVLRDNVQTAILLAYSILSGFSITFASMYEPGVSIIRVAMSR